MKMCTKNRCQTDLLLDDDLTLLSNAIDLTLTRRTLLGGGATMVWQGGTADRKTTVTPETVGLLVEKCGAAFRSRCVVCLQALVLIVGSHVFQTIFSFTQCNRRSCPTSHTPPLVGPAHTLRISSSQGMCLLSGLFIRGTLPFCTLGRSLLHLHTCKMRVSAPTAVLRDAHHTFSPWAIHFSHNQPLTSHNHTQTHTTAILSRVLTV
jgi:hypothetical protein